MQIDSYSNETDSSLRQVGAVRVLDLEPKTSDLLTDALAGLRAEPKTLPCKYLYDTRGSDLFERITQVPEYYPTRTELAIMSEHAEDMARAIGPNPWLVEFGSGSGLKTERLLEALDDPVGCVLMDISMSALLQSAEHLAARFRGLDVLAVCADYTQDFGLPQPRDRPGRITGYFPGSTIGNFSPAEACTFLRRVRTLVGDGGSLLLGFDRVKDVDVLEAAYNDREGVTAAFNLNLLRRLKDAGAELDEKQFSHRAVYNTEADRIEMHLVSQQDQSLVVGGEHFSLRAGESICTEHSHKYRVETFAKMVEQTGFELDAHWTDPRGWFSVCHLVAR